MYKINCKVLLLPCVQNSVQNVDNFAENVEKKAKMCKNRKGIKLYCS